MYTCIFNDLTWCCWQANCVWRLMSLSAAGMVHVWVL